MQQKSSNVSKKYEKRRKAVPNINEHRNNISTPACKKRLQRIQKLRISQRKMFETNSEKS